jgi:hypothetical protein
MTTGRLTTSTSASSFRKTARAASSTCAGAGQRSLRKIEFWYDTAGGLRGRADVTVFGMK